MPVRIRNALNGDRHAPDVAQRQHPAGDREGEIAEGLVQHDAVIFRPRLRQHRIAVLARPVEGAGVDDHAADRVAVAAEKFRQRMHDDVGAIVDRLAQIRRRQRVVDDQRHAGALGDLGDRLDVGDDAARIGDRLDEDRLGLGRDRALEGRDVVGLGPDHVPAEVLEGVVELVDRAAIELLGGDELVARLHQAVEDEHLRGVARRRSRGLRCRLRARRRAPPARRWSDCRCANRCCRRSAGRTARPHGRRLSNTNDVV